MAAARAGAPRRRAGTRADRTGIAGPPRRRTRPPLPARCGRGRRSPRASAPPRVAMRTSHSGSRDGKARRRASTSSQRSRVGTLARLSVPRHRRTPASRSSGTGARPTPSVSLLRGQRTTNTPRARQQRAVGGVHLHAVRGHQARRAARRGGRRSAPGSSAGGREGHVAQPAAGEEGAPLRRLRRPGTGSPAADSARWMAAGRRRASTIAVRSAGETECGACAASDTVTVSAQVEAAQARVRPPRGRGRAARRIPADQLEEHDGRAATRRPAGRGGRARSRRRPRPRCPSPPACAIAGRGLRAHGRRARPLRARRPAARPSPRSRRRREAPGQVRQLEVAVRVDEAGHQHAGTEVARVPGGRSRGGRPPSRRGRPRRRPRRRAGAARPRARPIRHGGRSRARV